MRKHTILFVAASPDGTPALDLGREASAIELAIELGKHRSRFAFKTRWAAQPNHVLRWLRRLRPWVVHFACHGGSAHEDGLALESSDGRRVFVTATGLADAFDVVGESVELVVINACHSAGLAEALCRHVDYVVGIAGDVTDAAAREFAVGLYAAISDGAPVPDAFRQALSGFNMLPGPAAALPQIWQRPGGPRRRRSAVEPRLQRTVRAAAIDVRLVRYLSGALGAAALVAGLAIGALGTARLWFAAGESTFDLRAEQLTVESRQAAQPVQHGEDVHAVLARGELIEGAAHGPTSSGQHRIALTGEFAAIDLGGEGESDRACRLHFVASGAGLAVDRATQDGTPCPHAITVFAGRAGLRLALDDEPGAPIAAALERVVLRVASGTPVTLAPQHGQLALFRPADNAVWSTTRLEATAVAGEQIGLPGALRSSDGLEAAGDIELRELRLDGDRLVVKGALRRWSGSVGADEDWDAAAPWPRGSTCGWAALAALVLAALAVMRGYLRWRGFGARAGGRVICAAG